MSSKHKAIKKSVNRRAKNRKFWKYILWQDFQKTPSLILSLFLLMSAGVPPSVQMRAELANLKPYAKMSQIQRVLFPSPKSSPKIMLLQMKGNCKCYNKLRGSLT